jgi:putative ABC transport system ATP-binding protein
LKKEQPLATTLQTESLSKIYQVGENQINAVDQVSIAVTKGEFVALVGPSGSGKTTLLGMVAGLLDPTEGTITVNDQNIGGMSDAERTKFRRQNIGFTFQENNLIAYLTARENVELMLRLNGQFDTGGQDRAVGLLEELGLGDRLDNLPNQLSEGQRQRVAIARALIHEPDVVLADEPTASLDTERAYQVVETFADLIRSQDRAGIMVTHDLRMCYYVDRVIELVDAQIERIIEEKEEIEALAAAGRLNGNNDS